MLALPKLVNHESNGLRGSLFAVAKCELTMGGNIKLLPILNRGSRSTAYDFNNLLSERKTVVLSPLKPLSRLRVALSGCVITISEAPKTGTLRGLLTALVFFVGNVLRVARALVLFLLLRFRGGAMIGFDGLLGIILQKQRYLLNKMGRIKQIFVEITM